MIESRRRAYLEALGIEVWVTRSAPPEPGRLIVSPDASGTLLICNVPEDSATRFAGDVVRALGGQATWAWPDPGGGENGVRLAAAIADRLITRVIVFGPGPARWLFGGEPPEAIGSAVIAAAPGLDELAGRASAKRAFWRLLQEFSDAAAPASH
jgi:DNA polymerase III psi subunit